MTIYVPDDGYAHATFGYAGMVGALAGISENGLVVGEVGSQGVLEKLDGEPWTLRFRELMTHAADLDASIPYMVNDILDGFNRPATLGYNFMVGWGDPKGKGTNARAAVFETNGGVLPMYYRDSRCSDMPRAFTYDRNGRIDRIDDLGESPLVNLEADAKEVDVNGAVRLFKQENGQFVRDAQGYFIEDPAGVPMPTGRYTSCALYRGDAMLNDANRRWQTTTNGPSGDDPKEVMNDSGNYHETYVTMSEIFQALWTGASYSAQGQTWVPAGSPQRQIGMDEATTLVRAAALDVNIMSVVYDATGLKVRLAYENGSGADWNKAADSPYYEIDMAPLFAWN